MQPGDDDAVSSYFSCRMECAGECLIPLNSGFPPATITTTGRPGRQMSGERKKGGHYPPELQAYPRLLEPLNGDLIGDRNRG